MHIIHFSSTFGDVHTVLQYTPSFITDRSMHHLCNSRSMNMLFTPSVSSDFNPLFACHIVYIITYLSQLKIVTRLIFSKKILTFLTSWFLYLYYYFLDEGGGQVILGLLEMFVVRSVEFSLLFVVAWFQIGIWNFLQFIG